MTSLTVTINVDTSEFDAFFERISSRADLAQLIARLEALSELGRELFLRRFASILEQGVIELADGGDGAAANALGHVLRLRLFGIDEHLFAALRAAEVECFPHGAAPVVVSASGDLEAITRVAPAGGLNSQTEVSARGVSVLRPVTMVPSRRASKRFHGFLAAVRYEPRREADLRKLLAFYGAQLQTESPLEKPASYQADGRQDDAHDDVAAVPSQPSNKTFAQAWHSHGWFGLGLIVAIEFFRFLGKQFL